MPASIKFPGAEYDKLVTGYRISACYKQGQGFGGNFFVYVQVTNDAKTPLATANLLDKGPAARGKLMLTGGNGKGVTHTFPDIDLIGAGDYTTRNRKIRVLEFQYTADTTDVKNVTPTFKSDWNGKVAPDALGDNYKFDIGGGQENLMQFEVRRQIGGPAWKGAAQVAQTTMRFTSLANKLDAGRNCWLTKLMEYAKPLQEGEQARKIGIQFANKPINAEAGNLDRAYVSEDYGDMLDFPRPTLAEYAEDQRGDVARWTGSHPATREFSHTAATSAAAATGDHIQSAVFVFKGDNFRDFSVP